MTYEEATTVNDIIPDDESTHQIPGWDRPAWAVRGVKDAPELIWQREASVDVTYSDGGWRTRLPRSWSAPTR